MPDLAPMLADRGLPRGDLAGWAAEPKLDGWRAVVVVDPGRPDGVVVRTRRGHRITSSVPGIGAPAALGHRVLPPLRGPQDPPVSDTSGSDGYGTAMERDEGKIEESGDGRPVEVRQGEEPQPAEEAEEDIPDPETVENVGY